MKRPKEDIILIGGGGHCSSVIDVIEQQGIYRIAGIVDLKEKLGDENLGYKVIGNDDDLPTIAREYKNFFITLGQLRTPLRRMELFQFLCELGVNLPFIISPHAYVSKHACIGKGSVIMHMAQVNANATIGNNCIINSKALIEHDAVIEDNCHISTGAIINGGVYVEKGTFVGSGAVTKQYIRIPGMSFIKANTLLTGTQE
ncbi:MAG: acetyltransferase [Bacteroidales bacterium]|nr:acetyltransferase [Bacteroidales bacterium]